MIAVAVAEQIGKFPVFDVGALDLLRRLVAVGDLHAVGDAAHVDLRGGGALARMKALRRQNQVELSVFSFDDIALANRTGDDFHGIYPRLLSTPVPPIRSSKFR